MEPALNPGTLASPIDEDQTTSAAVEMPHGQRDLYLPRAAATKDGARDYPF
jgi:hypothetical protein